VRLLSWVHARSLPYVARTGDLLSAFAPHSSNLIFVPVLLETSWHFLPLNKPPYMPSKSKDQRLASVWRWGSAISQQVPNSLFLRCLAARTIRHQMDVAPLPSLAVPTCSLLLLSCHGRHHSSSDIFSWFACCVFAGICLGFPVGFTILSPIRQRWETARSWTDHFFLGSVAVRFISPPQGRFFLPCRCN